MTLIVTLAVNSIRLEKTYILFEFPYFKVSTLGNYIYVILKSSYFDSRFDQDINMML